MSDTVCLTLTLALLCAVPHPAAAREHTAKRQKIGDESKAAGTDASAHVVKSIQMATCPKCFGALTEHHKCPKGRLSRVTDAVSTVGVGAIIGIVLSYAIDERPVPALVVASAALGAVLASAVRQAVGGRS